MEQIAGAALDITLPTLPKGGGTIAGMAGTLETGGSDGIAHMSIPLPITPGRGYAPGLVLSYSSTGGSSAFGHGWSCTSPGFSRRTGHGILSYTGRDTFLGPDGTVLIPRTNESGTVPTLLKNTVLGFGVGDHAVTVYHPRTEGAFDRIEYWVSQSSATSFWLVWGSDGQVLCYGRNPQAQIADPHNSGRVAGWLLEESLAANGESICYEYIPEDRAGVAQADVHEYGANRYLHRVWYGNATPVKQLRCLLPAPPSLDYHFELLFDYGARGLDPSTPPAYGADAPWPLRQDPVSDYSYGFEVRTARLCRQVLMYHHHFAELGPDPFLARRLLLDYDETPVVTQLTGVQLLAYEPDGRAVAAQPLDLAYSQPDWQRKPDWRQLPVQPLAEAWDGGYSIVDLYGEGIPGILSRTARGWQYCEPIRDPVTGGDAVSYGGWQRLEQLPSLQSGMLTDLDGDGYLEWLAINKDTAGYWQQNPDRHWSGFIPLRALPLELGTDAAQLIGITGSPAPDLVLIGPKSVRLYPNQNGVFQSGLEQWQKAGVTLPMQNVDFHELVAFSDILGSGQQHLVRIRHNQVTCWPNLGDGTFASPIELPGFSIPQEEFRPEQILLADMDGSGAADIVYALHDHVDIYPNQAGNGFGTAVSIQLPEGVFNDDLCIRNAADVRGNGMTDLVLSVPHRNPCDWHCSLFAQKPYLLTAVYNNLGGVSAVSYRSSAQYWLDEKAADNHAVCNLPFPLHLVKRIEVSDEVTGTGRVTEMRYRHGVYDRAENDLAGFRFIETVQAAYTDGGSASAQVPGSLTRTWYHTGRPEDEAEAWAEYWAGDSQAFRLQDSRLTEFSDARQADVPYAATDAQLPWMYRALIGMELRVESFNEGGERIYSTKDNRYQVRLLQDSYQDLGCVCLPMELESLGYTYETIPQDPQCSQVVAQQIDRYGTLLQSLSIAYPRRPRPVANPYPDTLPGTTWSSSYDDQQQKLTIARSRRQVYHLESESGLMRLGNPQIDRSDTFAYTADALPAGGLHAEMLAVTGTPLPGPEQQAYLGQTQVVYQGGDLEPDILALPYCTRSAAFVEEDLAAYDGALARAQVEEKLKAGGYTKAPCLLGDSAEADVWIAERGYTWYRQETGSFPVPIARQDTQLTGKNTVEWDRYSLGVLSIEDALGNRSSVEYDYRFPQPYRAVDANGNSSYVHLDALGRVIYAGYRGTEAGKVVGFAEEYPGVHPLALEELLDLTELPVASYQIQNLFRQMGQADLKAVEAATGAASAWEELLAAHAITFQGHIRARGHSGEAVPEAYRAKLGELFRKAARSPVYTAAFATNRYPGQEDAVISAEVTLSGGIGVVQQSTRADPGAAYQFSGDAGLVVDSTGRPIKAQAPERWIVSGINQLCGDTPIAAYRPFFLNTWEYAGPKAGSLTGNPVTPWYDPMGRIVQTVDAKGFVTRSATYPWFSVSEDANDTLV